MARHVEHYGGEMSVHLSEPTNKAMILADICLRELTRQFVAAAAGFTWSYGEVTAAHLEARDYVGVVLPVLNSAQAERLSRLVTESPLVAIIGVVTDPFGALTYQAIQAGAACVINTLIPVERTVAALEALLVPVDRPDPMTDVPAVWPGRDPLLHVEFDDQDALLIDLVCAGTTTAELSTRFYCSERSMYRRLRELYDRLSVTNRRELREVITRSPHRVMSGRRPHLVVPKQRTAIIPDRG